jgi:hypothetical protein
MLTLRSLQRSWLTDSRQWHVGLPGLRNQPSCLVDIFWKGWSFQTIHELKRKKQKDIILKLDFEKAYDKVNWDFLQQVLRMKGFPNMWCQWMERVVSKGSVCVQVNDNLGHFFQTKKGLRQGDPLSPVLFNLVADMLAVLIERSKGMGFFDGLVPHLVEDGLSILQYADDTILFFG